MIDIKSVKKIMEFSKIGFGEDELYEVIQKMEEIMPVIDNIKKGEATKDTKRNTFLYSNLRDDLEDNTSFSDDILKNAKTVENKSFVVPKII